MEIKKSLYIVLCNFNDRNGGIDTSDILNFILNFFVSTKDSGAINDVALVIAVLFLLLALCVSIYISKRNNLYIRPVKEEIHFQLIREDEVA